MVKFALPLVALAMTASMAVAAPAPTSGTSFSFEKWVEDIITNPETALTVDEAIAASRAAEVVGSAGGLRALDDLHPLGPCAQHGEDQERRREHQLRRKHRQPRPAHLHKRLRREHRACHNGRVVGLVQARVALADAGGESVSESGLLVWSGLGGLRVCGGAC